jgi:vacuolar-type H+-ATPase subunit E/Vma4
VTATLLPTGVPAVPDPLDPLRAALLAHARRDAEQALATARAEAEQALATARAEAQARRATARDEGERDAEAVRVQQQARARRAARAVLLAAQHEALDVVRAQARAAVREWWDDPQLRPAVRERLAVRARAALGPDAVVRDHPAGGVVAQAADRRATYVLGDLADASLDGLGPDLVRVWAP